MQKLLEHMVNDYEESVHISLQDLQDQVFGCVMNFFWNKHSLLSGSLVVCLALHTIAGFRVQIDCAGVRVGVWFIAEVRLELGYVWQWQLRS
jgi:hypothetical protein